VLGERLPPERLSVALRDPEEVTCQAALQVAAHHPTWDDLTTLGELARDSTGSTQSLALQVLSRYGPQLDLALLATFLVADSQPLSEFAARQLGQRHDPASLQRLLGAYRQTAEGARWIGAALRERARELTAEQVALLPEENLEPWERVLRAASQHADDPAARDLLLGTLFDVAADEAIWPQETAQALANLVEAQPELLARVADMAVSPIPARRTAAVAVLRFLKTATATDLLAQVLAREQHPDWGLICAIRDRHVPVPLEALIPALHTNVDEAREYIADLLGQTHDPAAVEPLLASLLLPGRYGHEGATRALLALKEHCPMARITELGAAPSSWQRCMALTLAGARPDVPQAFLLAGLEDPATRRAALAALAERGEPFPAAAVAVCATDADVWVRVQAARALAVLGKACPPEPILSLLGDTAAWTHAADTAREALAQIPAARRLAGPAALAYTRTGQPGTWMGIRSRCQATQALARIALSDPAAWEDLEASLKWPHWQVRLVALHSMREVLIGRGETDVPGEAAPTQRWEGTVPPTTMHAVATLCSDPEALTVRHAAARTLDTLLGCGFDETEPEVQATLLPA
jgi:hypothetical protein